MPIHRTKPWKREVPMTIGESSERVQNAAQACADLQAAAPAGAKVASKAHMRSLTQRVFSIFLAVALAVSMTPSAALAETQGSVSPVAQNETQKVDAPDAGQVTPAPDSTEQAEAPSLPSSAQESATESGDNDKTTDTASGSVASDTEKVDDDADAAGAADHGLRKDADHPVVQAPEQDVPAAAAEKAPKEEAASLINATCSVIGVDAQGNRQTWAAAQSFSLEEGATAATLTEELFKRTGLKADYNPNGSWGWTLNAVSSPFEGGSTLSFDPATGNYWQLFINGSASPVGAGGHTLKEGDSVVWAFTAYGDSAPTNDLSVSCEVIGQDADGNQQIWAQSTTIDMSEGSNAADLTRALFKQAGLVADIQDTAYGFYLSTITSPFDKGLTLGYDPATWSYWQLFVNGEPSEIGASGCILHAGDKVSWVYGSDGTMPGQMNVTVEVIGQDGNGKAERWAQRSRNELATASFDDICLSFFKECELDCELFEQGSVWDLISITSPSGVTLKGGWNCLINGKAINGAAGLTLKSGDTISWVHGTNVLPNLDEVTIDPSATRPDWKADWAGDQSRPTTAATPTDYMKSDWTLDYKQYSSAQYANASEPVIVNGFVYLAVNNRLLKIDSSTGKVVAQANLVSSIGFTTRPVYAQGVIMVPLDGGAVQALTADNLTTVWATDKLSDSAQSNSAITVNGNYAYVGTCDVDFVAGTYDNGFLTCINILTGAVVWRHNNAGEGYYWGGAVNVGGYTVVATGAGTVEVLSGAGSVVSTVSLGALVNSSCVASADGKTLYVMSRDGKLHVLAIDEQGSLKEAKVVDWVFPDARACLPSTAAPCMSAARWKAAPRRLRSSI